MHDERLREIYLCDDAGLTNQKQRYVQLLDRYETLYGDEKRQSIQHREGSEVSGNHTVISLAKCWRLPLIWMRSRLCQSAMMM